MEKIAICLDGGGTFTKGMVFNQENQPLLKELIYYESRSDQSKDVILTNFVEMIMDLIQQASAEQHEVSFIGLAFPGPFAYEAGISLMEGLEKFASLFQVNVKQELLTRLKQHDDSLFSNCELYFINDAVAFAYGENAVSKVDTGAYLTLGTGLGSTFLKKKEIIRGGLSIPESGMIFDQQFKQSIVDDYLSARGLQSIAKAIFETEISGKELYDLAEKNNAKALLVFQQFGSIIGEAIRPYLESLEADELVLGGQISKSFPYFKESLLKFIHDAVLIRTSKDTSMSILNGVFICYQEGVPS